MNDNTIVAIVIIVVLAAMAIGGTYIYNLRAKMRQEMTIVRVESQKQRMHQLHAASAAVVRARQGSRGQSRGRSRARSRRRDVSPGYDRRAVVDRDQNRNQNSTGNKGKKEQEQQKQKQDGDTRPMRSSGRRAPLGSRSGSKRPAQSKWESNGAMNNTEQRPKEWDNQSNNSNDWEQYNNTDKTQDTSGYNQAEKNDSKDDRDNKSGCFDWNAGSKNQTNDNNNGGGQKGGWSSEASDAMATQKTALLLPPPPSPQPADNQPASQPADVRDNEQMW